MGLSAAAAAALIEAEDAAHNTFEVWPVNMPIVDAFLAVATQWRTVALVDGRVMWMGLDYTAVHAHLAAIAVVLNPGQLLRLGTMEREASDALNGVRG